MLLFLRTVFDGREVQPDQMINISGSLDKKSAPVRRSGHSVAEIK